jgi:small-conductance mechanosensitive channel
MTRTIDPIRPTQSVVSWLIENREGVLIGALVASAIVALMLVARLIGGRMVSREAEAEHLGWRSVVGRVLARTSIFFMVVAAIDIVASYAQPPARAQRLADAAFTIAFALQGAIWARELILALIARRVGYGTTESALGNATSIIRVLVSVALFALAIVVILDNLGVNVTALVAGLGIGGIAIGLAAQGIFSDLFAALAILFDKPFKRGDTIRHDNTTGTVQRIGLKTTRLRSLTGEQRVMANTKLLEREIHNLSEAKARRMTIHFAVEGKAAGETLDGVAAAAAEAVEGRKNCKLVRCVLTGVGSGALAHELVYDDPSRDNNVIAGNRAGVLRTLIESLERRNLDLMRASDMPPPLEPF